MSDIRKFFSPSAGSKKASSSKTPVRQPPSPKKSSLHAERTDTGSPKAKTLPKRSPKINIPAALNDDEDSDFEDPVPKAVKPELKKKQGRKSKKNVISSSEEKFFNESIVAKANKAAEPKKSPLRKRSQRMVIESDSDVDVVEDSFIPGTPKTKARQVDTQSPVRRSKRGKVISSESELEPSPKKPSAKRAKIFSDSSEAEASPKKSRKAKEKSPEEAMEIDEPEEERSEEEEEEVAKPKKRGRRRTPPNQQKLDAILQKKVPANKQIPKALPKPKEQLKGVSAADFFASSATAKVPSASSSKVPAAAAVVTVPSSSDEEVVPRRSTRSSPRKAATSPTKSPSASPKKQTREPFGDLSKKELVNKKTPPKKKSKPVESGEVMEVDAPKPPSKKKSVREPLVPPRSQPTKVVVGTEEGVKVVRQKPVEMPWVDKYKPTARSQLVGQGTDKSPTNKLLGWLKDWAKNNLGVGGLVKKPKPAPFMAQSDGTAFKAALLSGPPGIGKTTSAVLCCQELGWKYVEMNASDARNKKLLADKVAELLSSRQVNEFFVGETPNNKANSVTHVLIMDEIDGMSGNQDRAGIAEVIQMIKDTKIPIICICNDRQSQKIRSLANHCFDLRFQRPRVEQIRGRLMTIMAREKLKLSKETVDQLMEASNHDVRQCIYSLQLIAAGSKGGIEKKDVSVNIFEAARRMLSNESTLAEKQELYFGDYSIMPLFVFENYPNVRSSNINNLTHLKALRKAATVLTEGDLIEKQVRSEGAWNLLPGHGMLSCAVPAKYLDGHLTEQLAFPSWLGRNSTALKRQRMMRQLACHTHLKITGTCQSIVSDYLPVLRDRMLRPLVKHETEGVQEVVEVYKYYDLTRDDTEAIHELALWPDSRDIGQRISTKTKSALTRTLNKESRLLPYCAAPIAKGRKTAVAAEEAVDEEGHVVVRKIGAGSDDEEEEEEKSDETNDIKVKDVNPATTSKGGATKRGSASGRGRGRGAAKRGK